MESWATHGVSIPPCWKNKVKELNVPRLWMGSSETPEIPRDPHQAAVKLWILQFIPEFPPKNTFPQLWDQILQWDFSLLPELRGQREMLWISKRFWERIWERLGWVKHGVFSPKWCWWWLMNQLSLLSQRYVTTSPRSQRKHPKIPRKSWFLSLFKDPRSKI